MITGVQKISLGWKKLIKEFRENQIVIHNLNARKKNEKLNSEILKINIEIKKVIDIKNGLELKLQNEIENILPQFHNQVTITKALLDKNGLPHSLNGRITQEDLGKIYDYIHADWKEISAGLIANRSYRIPKELDIPRTIDLVIKEDGRIGIILETKRKIASGKKDFTLPRWSGAYKVVKQSWDITEITPKQMVTMVIKEDTLSGLEREAFEEDLSLFLSVDASDPNCCPIMRMQPGSTFKKKGKYKKYIHADCAVGTLEDVIKGKLKVTDEENNQVALSIAQGIKIMHDKGVAHQDIKPENIFLFRSNSGKLFASIGDFGLSSDINNPRKLALATYDYASPEIFLAYQVKGSAYYDYYTVPSKLCRAKDLNTDFSAKEPERSPSGELAKTYRKSDLSNDIWALGVTFFQMYYGNEKYMFSKQDLKITKQWLRDMLSPKREDRCNIDQVISALDPTFKERKEKQEKELIEQAVQEAERKAKLEAEYLEAERQARLEAGRRKAKLEAEIELARKVQDELERVVPERITQEEEEGDAKREVEERRMATDTNLLANYKRGLKRNAEQNVSRRRRQTGKLQKQAVGAVSSRVRAYGLRTACTISSKK